MVAVAAAAAGLGAGLWRGVATAAERAVHPAHPALAAPAELRFEVVAGVHPEAVALVRRRYEASGLRIGGGRLGPGVTVLARDGKRPCATLRLGVDSPAGLQCEALYASEVGGLRRYARRLAEVTQLAIDGATPPVALLRQLFEHALDHLRHEPPITDLLIEVHPRHARLYVDRFGFVPLGDERLCARVLAPAVLLHRPLAPAYA